MKTFYKMRLVADEEGLEVVEERFLSIHETPCFHFCLAEWEYQMLRARLRNPEDETLLQHAKRHKKRIRRVAKAGSRIAQETREEAFERLQFLKHKQLRHMVRETEFIKAFLERTVGGIETLDTDARTGVKVVPGTRDLVRAHLVFY